MAMEKKKGLDETITTVEGFKHAVNGLSEKMQMFVQLTGYNDNDSALIEVTEIQAILPKTSDDEPYLVLRCK